MIERETHFYSWNGKGYYGEGHRAITGFSGTPLSDRATLKDLNAYFKENDNRSIAIGINFNGNFFRYLSSDIHNNVIMEELMHAYNLHIAPHAGSIWTESVV